MYRFLNFSSHIFCYFCPDEGLFKTKTRRFPINYVPLTVDYCLVLFSPYSPCFNLDEILAPWVEESNKSEDIPKLHVIPTKPRRSTSVDTGDQQLPNLIDLDEGQLDNIQFEMKPKTTLEQKDFDKGHSPSNDQQQKWDIRFAEILSNSSSHNTHIQT